MPELPEVETVRRGLASLITGKVVTAESHDTEKGFPNASSDVKQFLLGATDPILISCLRNHSSFLPSSLFLK